MNAVSDILGGSGGTTLAGAALGGLVGGPAGAAIGASIGGGIGGASAAQKAAQTQAQAADNANAVQLAMYNKSNELQEPFRQAGMAGQNRLMELLGIGGNSGAQGYGKYARDFSMADYQADPGYQFRLSEGLKSLDRQAAARGGLISGGALKAAQRYGQDYASNEYTNAFNRYQTNRANQLNPLQSLAGQGQTSANMLAANNANYASNVGENYANAANARASGYVGGANALTSGLGSALNYYQNSQFLNKLGGYGGGSSYEQPSYSVPTADAYNW